MYSITIGGVSFTNYVNLTITNELNQVPEAEFEIFDLTSGQEAVFAKGVVVYIKRSTGETELKGTIAKISYLDDSNSMRVGVEGQASILLDRIPYFDGYTDGRKEWTNTAGDVIIKELISGIMNEGAITPLPLISFRAEYDTVLGVISGICKVCGCDWWVDEDISYNDQLNIGAKGSGTPVGTLILGDDAAQDEADEDVNDEFNVIYVKGYGDGINQLGSVAFWATDNRTALSSSLSALATSATVDSGSSLPESGSVWIGIEKCTFTRVGDALALTRGADNTPVYAHSAGIAVVDAAYSIDSISEIKENRYVDKGIIDQDTLDRLAQVLITKYHITGKKGSCFYYGEETAYIVGDVFTIEHYDTTTEDFRIVGKSYSDADAGIILSYITEGSYYGDSIELTKNMNINNPYGQGSTNIFQVQSYENCDNTHPLHVRFRIPDDVIAINKVYLSFKRKAYRVYSVQAESDGDHSHASYFNLNARGSSEVSGEIIYLVGAVDKTFDLLMTGNPSTMSKSVSNATADVSHTHPIQLGIAEDSGFVSGDSITVKAGEDGTTLTEVSGSPFTADQNDLSIVSLIGEPGKWYDVEFTPASGKLMRIEANVYVKCFVRSN